MKRQYFLQRRLLIVPAILVALLMTTAGCMDMGGSGRLVWYESEDGTTPIIPELPADEPGDPGSPIPLPPSTPDDGGGDGGGSSAYVPNVQFDFEESTYRSMAERSITVTFEDAVDDCGTPAVNELIEVTDALDTPLDAVYDYSWNEACTELNLQNIPLTYNTLYKVLLKQGLFFAGNELESILATEFTTPGNYYSINATRFGNYPTLLRADTKSPFGAYIYAGSDMLPATLPRDPISFTPEDVTAAFEYAPETVWLGYPLNAGDGRFMYTMQDSDTGGIALMLWRDLSLEPISIAQPVDSGSPKEIGYVAFTEQADPDLLSFNGNTIQDVVVSVYNSDNTRYEIYVFYDWPNETADLVHTEADWSLIPNAQKGSIAVGDFDNDGRQDLCVVNMDGMTERNEVVCYPGEASGLSETPMVQFLFSGSDDLETLHMGDVNCDGYSDVVVGGYWVDFFLEEEGNFLAVLPGGADVTGSLMLGMDLDIALRIESSSIDFADVFSVNDVNGDACSDIFAADGNRLNPRMFAYKGASTIAYGAATTIDAELDADLIFTDADVSGDLGSMLTTYMDINGDGYKDLVYGETVIDNDNLIWLHEQLFMPGGTDFFGETQTTINRSDTSAQFIDLTGPLEM